MSPPPTPGTTPRPTAPADPDRVRIVVERLGEHHFASLGPDTQAAVRAVAGASDSLGDFVVEDEGAMGVLDDLEAPVPLAAGSVDDLRVSHRRAFLRIAARDLLGTVDLATTVGDLSALASATLTAACALAEADDLVVVGMGKYGAGELNFVSDVDVLFVSEADPDAATRAARRVLDVASQCVRVDVGLRPGGRDGALVRSLASYVAHWERWADPWEFQALLKASATVGPEALRRGFDEAVAQALWGRPFTRDALHDIRRLKARSEQEVARRGLTDREVKRGRGGIRDIEFSVQLLQLVHGGADPALRVRPTLAALRQLVDGGYVDDGEADTLARAYEFLRRVEHRLQLVNEQQTHTIPDDRVARRRLARAMGYRGEVEGGPTERFDRDLAMHRLAVRRVHEGWYFRPLLDAFAGVRHVAVETSRARLSAFGFRDVDRTEQAVRELSRGLTRSSRLMRQLLPLLLDWLADGPDPGLGLLGLRRLATGEQRAARLTSAFRDSAETARRVCDLLSTTGLATDLLEANPDLVERLDDASRLRTASRERLLASAWDAVGWRDDNDQQPSLHRWFRRNLLGIVARDVAGVAEPDDVGADLSALTEAVVETAVRLAAPAVPFAVIGMGRLGGQTLSYASDVDLVFVHDGEGERDRTEAERVATQVLRLLQGPTPAMRIVAVDIDLRPEGRQGPLVRSLDSYTIYLQRWAELWELQSLLRARPVAGDEQVGRGFLSLVEQASWGRPPTADDHREIMRLKARMETERIPRGVEPWRHAKLGPGALTDIEWTVQLLQWRAGVHGRGTLRTLDRLVADGHVSSDDAGVLEDAHRWCDRLRNRAWLTAGVGDVLPSAPEPLGVLARSLGTDPPTLVDEHRRRLRRSRRVVERLFYGTA